MPRPAFRRPLALAAVFAVGVAATLTSVGTASASHPGTTGTLTASNGGKTLQFADGRRVTSSENISDAAWSPDGSRAVFVTAQGVIATLRFDNGEDIFTIASPQPDKRADPHWVGDGGNVVWAAKPPGRPWHLEFTVNAENDPMRQISPDDGRHYLNPDTGSGQRIVVQRQEDAGGEPTGTPEIGFLAPDSGYTTIAANASKPSLSPDGTRVAFIRSDGEYDQVWVCDLAGGDLVQVTSNPVHHDEPAWSPHGLVIAFSQGGRVYQARPDGSDAANPLSAGLSGKPAYRPFKQDRVVRLFGANRFTTAAAVSRSYWSSLSEGDGAPFPAEAVVLSRSDTFADALGGSALAAAKRGPLLMTPPDTLDETTRIEIQRILSPGRTVYLLGSAGAISETVRNQLNSLGYEVKRLAGPDRFSTSIAIANEVDPSPDTVLAATGMDFPDALAAGAAAGAQNRPGSGESAVVVLTQDSTLAPATKTYLDGLPDETTLFAIGRGAAAATEAHRALWLVGDDRYDTAYLTAWWFFGGERQIGFATGTNWPDALAGGALMATLDGPLMLTPGESATLGHRATILLDEFSASVEMGLIFGSPGVMDPRLQADIGKWIDGWNGYHYVENPSAGGSGKTAARSGAAEPAVGAGSTGLRRSPADFETVMKAARERLAR
ncbi:cell wall-binding repeat-containing protein [Plantactinospora sp. CA-290183]|uniref:cell wall-binding repeat-containing protein n=1 Tax=Plantactinospora sp. CA-290183 TaxID=3240006 RepID=UPI003D9154CB